MSKAILEVKNISKIYGGKQVVNDESFFVFNGDILGLIGPNGAGKSTSVNMITTLIKPESGSILFDGEDIFSKGSSFKKNLGVVPQDLAIYDDLSAYENVRFFCSLYGYRGAELKKRVKDALEFVGLWERKRENPNSFSGGMKRRLNIACAIAHTPKLLIMDEPTVGIDPQSRNKILETVKVLHEKGTAVIYISHYMEEIEAVCNRIVLIDKGIVIENLDKKAYKEKYAQLGLETLEDIFLYITKTDLRDMEV